MRLLLIEDDENKRVQIEDFVKREVADAVIDGAKSLQSGIRAVRSYPYDMILLDMTLPAFDVTPTEDGFQYLSYGGRQFLEQLDRLGIIVPVAVVTGFDTFGEGKDGMTLDELDTSLAQEFPETYAGKVWYSPVIDRWKQELAGLLSHIPRQGGM